MSEKEQEILETIGKALPHMSEFQKGHILGVAETMAQQNKAEQQGNEAEQGGEITDGIRR